jgi:penicillin-binding protein 2
MKKIGPTFSDYVITGTTKKRNHGKTILSREARALFPLLVLFACIAVLFARLFYLQIIRGNYYVMLSDQNRTRGVTIAAPRGIIFDRNGKPLVSNSPAFEVLKDNKVQWLDKDTALELLSQGKDVVYDVQRNYIYKDAFSHVLGYVGQISQDELMLPEYSNYSVTDFNGKSGLEKQYESILHGQNGKKLFEVDAQGKEVRFLGQQDPIPGQNITTTLDTSIQLSVAKAMKDVKKGAVIVSDPNTGGILALYSKPSFDPNLFTRDSHYVPSGDYKNVNQILTDYANQPLLDRSIAGVYPPGSTYKLITATAGLQTGAITGTTQIEDTGEITAGGTTFGNWYYQSYGKKEGFIDVIAAIKRSNDIFFYKTAQQTGIKKLDAWSQTFGLGKTLGIDLPGEASGTVPSPSWKEKEIGDQWYLGDTYNTGIGQGYLLTTPLQVNMWTVPFANGGILYKPHVLNEKPQIVKKDFIKPENINLVRQGMEEVCQPGGVAYPFFDFKVKNDRLPIDNKDYFKDASGSASMTRVAIGCKTGTAQVGGADTESHAWITVFAPFYNPEVVVTVLVENSGEGSDVAAPIAKSILTDYFQNKK